jgi:hypothetical protein
MRDLRSELIRNMKRIKAGNMNKRGALPGDMAPKVVEKTVGTLVTFPPFKVENGKRISETVIRFRR